MRLILIAMALWATAGRASAYCPPEVDYSVRGEFNRADYVGVVRVVGATWLDEQRRPTTLTGNLMLGTIPGGFDPYVGAYYRVVPKRTFKGAPKPLTIFSENTEARTPLNVGARYLVFLERQTVGDEYRRVGDMMIDYCGNSALLTRAGRALTLIEHSTEYDRLEDYLRDKFSGNRLAKGDLAYTAASIDLGGDGAPEVVVRLSGDGWCGSGGCVTLVLARDGRSYRLISKITITQLPIRVLQTRHHGWRDLGVTVGGGGIMPGYEAALAFDGRRYPTNPSIPPARRLAHVVGRILIGEDDPARTIPVRSKPRSSY